MKNSQCSEYASMDTTNVLSSYFMTVVSVDMHRFALTWLVYSRNKFFRVDPNISENSFRGGGPILGGPKRDMPAVKFRTHTPSVASFAVFLDRNINSCTASDEEIWQRGYGGRSAFSSTIQVSPP